VTANQPEAGPCAATGREAHHPVPVIFLIDHIWSGHGGTEGQLLQLIAGLDRRRFEPRLVVLYDRSEFIHSDQVPCPCRCLGLQSRRQARYWRLLAAEARAIRRVGPAILHTTFPESVTAGPWLARLAGAPHVTWRRDLGYWITPGVRRLLRWSSRWTACCVTNSEAVRAAVIRNEGLRPGQLAVVRNTVDLAELEQVRTQNVGAALNLPPGTVSLVFPANLRPVKGGDIVLAALARARAAGARLHLVSIGENSFVIDEYRRRCEELHLSDAVTFLGHLPRGELLSWVKGCDIAVNASYSEGYSNSNVETMVLQRPLIATAVGGNLEQVSDDETGCLVPAGNAEAMAAALLDLYHDPARRLALGAAGAQRMRALHGTDEMAARHEAIYARVLAAAGKTNAG
jgi:glycosyltransferase involved in cell wall biosynthesis